MKNLLASICSCLIAGLTFAQSHKLTVDFQNYEPLLESTSLNQGQIWDDPVFLIPFGFEFRYGGKVHEYVCITDFGFGSMLAFDSNMVDSNSLVLPFEADLIDMGVDSSSGSLSNISYSVKGEEGDRVCIIEWNNAGFYGDYEDNGRCTDFINFQVKLFEKGSIMEFHYGPSNINYPDSDYGFESGPGVGLLPGFHVEADSLYQEGFFLTEEPINPDQEVMFGPQWGIEYLNGNIPENLLYRFIPMDLYVQETKTVSVALFPNPVSNGVVNLLGNEDVLEGFIFNAQGQEVKAWLNPANNLDVHDLPAGMYFCRLRLKASLIRTLPLIIQ